MRRKDDTVKAAPMVHCCECRHFSRDTEGRSFNHDTGEYFLGICALGLHPDTIVKQFADKPRRCNNYQQL